MRNRRCRRALCPHRRSSRLSCNRTSSDLHFQRTSRKPSSKVVPWRQRGRQCPRRSSSSGWLCGTFGWRTAPAPRCLRSQTSCLGILWLKHLLSVIQLCLGRPPPPLACRPSRPLPRRLNCRRRRRCACRRSQPRCRLAHRRLCIPHLRLPLTPRRARLGVSGSECSHHSFMGLFVARSDVYACAPAEKRARILRDGQLTMIVYGSIEALTWARRVAMFQNAMRQAPQRSLPMSRTLLF